MYPNIYGTGGYAPQQPPYPYAQPGAYNPGAFQQQPPKYPQQPPPQYLPPYGQQPPFPQTQQQPPPGYQQQQQQNPYSTNPTPGTPFAANYQPQQPLRQLTGWYAKYYSQVSPQDLQRLQQWFRSVDRNNSGTVQAQDLAGIQFDQKPLGLTVATKLVKVFDKDQSGTIEFNEYVALQRFLEDMQNAFFIADKTNTVTIDAQQVHAAFSQAGFDVSMGTVQASVKKYSQTGGLDFPSFLFLCAHFAHCRSIYEWNDPQQTGQMHLTYDAFCHIGIDLI